MAAVSLKEALARGQCLCTCDFLRKGGCIWEVLGFPLYRECREGRQTDSLNRIQGNLSTRISSIMQLLQIIIE